MKEFFIVPMVGTGTREDAFRGKYGKSPEVVSRGTIRFARQDALAVVMFEAPQAYLDSVSVKPDALRISTEAALDQPLTVGQANSIVARLEANDVPAQWINPGDTGRELIRGIVGMFLFSQRLEGREGQGLTARANEHGVGLDTEWQDLPPSLQAELQGARDSFGLRGSFGVQGVAFRDLLRAAGNEFTGKPIFIGGTEV